MEERKSFTEWTRELLGMKPKPETRTIAPASVYDRYSDYPSNGLTPEKLARIFREADSGEVLSQMELFEEMEEKDPHLFSQLQTRKNAVTGLDFEIIAASASELDKVVADYIEGVLNSIEGFNDILFDLLDAIGKGIAISEINWIYKDARTTVDTINRCHQKNLFWDHEDRLKIITRDAPQGIFIPENKFIVHRYKARSGHPARAGILRVVAWMYLFKNYDVKDWVRFCEMFGMPIRLGKYNPGASENDKEQLMLALVQLGSDAAGILPDNTTIELKEGEKGTSINLYETLARYCDEQISKAVLGQTLTSDSGGGSYAQSKTHNEVRHDLTVADCKALASTLKRDLIRPLVIFNYGHVPIPEIRFDCSEAEDLKVESEIMDALTNKLGLKVPTGYVYKKFSIPQPEDGEDVLPGMQTQVVESPLPFKALKDNVTANAQSEIDSIVEKSVELSQPLFNKMFEPILKLASNAQSLEELREKLEDKELVAKLLGDMEVADFEELLQRAIMAAELRGRVIEDET